MIQTAEGALNETHAILQRMRELATQAANDTNTESDRGEIQKEINQLTSEINRIGNTTEFNTQSLLKGDGTTKLKSTGFVTDGALSSGENIKYTQAKATFTVSAKADTTDGNDEVTFNLSGIEYKHEFTTDPADTDKTAEELRNALQDFIDNNEALKGSFKVSGTGSDITIEALEDGNYKGAAGVIANVVSSNGGTGIAFSASTGDTGSTTPAVQASKTIDFSTISSDEDLKNLVGKGITINGQQIEFYNANDGAYTGDAFGVNISDALGAANRDDALVATIATQVGSKLEGVTLSVNALDNGQLDIKASEAGSAGNNIKVSDGGVQEKFSATFQVGANEGQSMTIEIADMRAAALGLTGKAGDAGFSKSNNVTNGTNNTDVEAALDVSTHEAAANAITKINEAIEEVSTQRSELGAYQNRLDHTINNLSTSSENLTAAESRIRDVDYALAA